MSPWSQVKKKTKKFSVSAAAFSLLSIAAYRTKARAKNNGKLKCPYSVSMRVTPVKLRKCI